jgi:hypothetical protein
MDKGREPQIILKTHERNLVRTWREGKFTGPQIIAERDSELPR